MKLEELRPNNLLGSNKSSELRRVVWTSASSAIVFVLDVTGTLPNGASRLPRQLTKAEFMRSFKSGWSVVANSLPTKEMLLPDSELTAETLETRNRNWKIIETLVSTEEALLTILHKDTRPDAISAAAKLAGVPVGRVYRLLTQFFWYGNGKSALTPRFSHRGVSKIDETTESLPKRGRPNSVTVLEGATIYQGKNVTKRDLMKFEIALVEYWAGEDLSISGAYAKMKDKLYVSSNQHKVRESTQHKVAEHFIPTQSQFRYHAKPIIARLQLWEKKKGHMDWAQKVMSRTGNATDITIGPTDIYDMDVVNLKCIAVTETDPPEVMGTVNACLAVDRASRAIPGFHFFLNVESWDAYRIALFRAFTSTEKHLERLGFDELARHAPDHAADGWCNGVFVDRGPARGRDGFMAVVNALKLERALAPKSRGDMKAVVESVNGKFQRQVALLPGGHNRVAGTRNEEQAKNAESTARLTSKQIYKFLAAAIAEHNEFHEVPQLLTKRMLYDNVAPVPVEIFKWGKKNIMGATARDHVSDSELYFLLLPNCSVSLFRGGVRHKGYYFSSPELIKFRHQNLSKKNLSIVISWDIADPEIRYWKMPNGILNVLTISKEGKKRVQGIEGEELKHFRIRELAQGIKRKSKKRSKAYISKTKEDIIAEANKRVSPKNHEPLLSPGDNKKIGIFDEKEELRLMSREHLLPKDFDIVDLVTPPPVEPIEKQEKEKTKASKSQASAAALPSHSPPANSSKPKTEEVSKARANFLKMLQSKKPMGDGK